VATVEDTVANLSEKIADVLHPDGGDDPK